MPTVPLIVNDRNLANLPGVDNRAPGPDAFGAGLGQGIQQLGGDISQMAIQYQQKVKNREDILAVENATTAYDKWSGDFTVGQMDANGNLIPGTGWLNRKGADARGASVALIPEEEKVYQRIANGLTDEQRLAFDQRRAVRLQNMRDRVAGHEAVEMKNDRIGSGLATSQARMSSAIADPDNDSKFNGQVVEGVGALVGALQEAGKSPEEINLAASKFKSDAIASRIGAILVRGRTRSDGAAAEADFKQADALRLAGPYADLLQPETKEKLALEVADARASWERNAQHDRMMAAQAESDRLHKEWMKVNWEDPRQVEAWKGQLRDSTNPSVAVGFYNETVRMQARMDDEQKKTAEEQQNEKADVAYRQMYDALDRGVYFDPVTGNPVYQSPVQRQVAIERAFLYQGLQKDDRNKLLGDVEKHKDARIQQMTASVLQNVIPDAAKYFAVNKEGAFVLDDSGRLVIGKPDGKDKKPFAPNQDTGLRRLYLQKVAPARPDSLADPRMLYTEPERVKTQTEALLLSDIQNVLGVVKDRMAVDGSMTIEAGVELFRKLAQPKLTELTNFRVQQELTRQGELINALRQNFERKKLTPPKPSFK